MYYVYAKTYAVDVNNTSRSPERAHTAQVGPTEGYPRPVVIRLPTRVSM
jgi:hypothetical protein